MNQLDLLLALEEAELEMKKQRSAKYVKKGESAGGLDPSDIDSIDPMAISEAGVDVGTDLSKQMAIRSALQGVTLGGADELRSVLTGQDLETQQKMLEEYKQAKPTDAMLTELSGAVMSPAQMLRGPQALQRMSNVSQGAVRAGAGGATYGALSAEGDLQERAEEGLYAGGFASLITGATGKLFQLIGLGNKLDSTRGRFTTEKLDELRRDAYDAVEDVFALGPGEFNVIFKQASEIADAASYIDDVNSPSIKLFKQLVSERETSMTLKQWDEVRKRLFKAADKDETWGDVTKKMIFAADGVVDDGLAAGNTPALKTARAAHSLYMRTKAVEDAFTKAGQSEARDVAGTYQKAARRLANSPQALRFFDEEEIKLLERFADGNFGDRVMRMVGKAAPNPSGMMMALNLGAVAVNPWFLLYNVATQGTKLLSDKNAVAAARNIVKDIGGEKTLKGLLDEPNPLDLTVGGYTGDQVLDALFGEEE